MLISYGSGDWESHLPVLTLGDAEASKLRIETQPKYMLNTSQQVKPAGDMLLVEIGNQAGFKQYSTARTDHAHTAFLAAVLQALNSNLPAPAHINAAAVRTYCSRANTILDNNSTPQQRTRAAAKVRKLPADTSMRICNTSTATPLLPQYTTAQLPLKYNWRHLAYTDGSYIDPKRTENEEATPASQPPASQNPAADTNSQPAELEQCEKVPRIGAAVPNPMITRSTGQSWQLRGKLLPCGAHTLPQTAWQRCTKSTR
jgi:hypothetical protein